jgi:hypothetical protein
MYDIVVTDEFARWFERLPDADAECVAALLGVVGELGPGLAAPRASRSLLWFDGTHVGEGDWGWGGNWQLRWRDTVDSLAHFDDWRREALRCLESSAFSRLLAGLNGREALTILRSVEQLRLRLRTARWALGGVLQGSAGARQALGEDLRALFDRVMRDTGLDPAGVGEPRAGLREVTVAELAPPARIIYGIDPAARRVVVLVADRLDHAYHGDCVRLAEALFGEYLAARGGTVSTITLGDARGT